MLLMAVVAVAAFSALAIVVVFGPHRTTDVLRTFGYSIKFFALLPFQLASALYAWLRRRETQGLHLLLLTALALLFGVPYLFLRFFGLFKDDEETGDGEVERIVWEREYGDPWGSEFEDIALVEGGTYDLYLYFRAEQSEEQKTVPRRRFVELTWLDDSESVITVDLRKIVEPAERLSFHDGAPERRLDKDGFNDRLRGLGSQWADLGEAPIAGIGDAVRVLAAPDAKEWWDVTVVGAPERAAEDMVRLPLRVSSRYRNARHFDDDLLQIGTTPDEFGVIGHLWTPRDFGRERERPADCLHGVEMQRDETREGAVYFSPTGRGATKAPPTEAFSTLWYGVNYMEMPVGLSPDG